MAIVEYTCNTCKRNILVPENRKGLDVFVRCIITADCRGVLSRGNLLPAYLRGNSVVADVATDNWIPRKILYTQEQPLLSSKWIVPHNLNNYPDVNVYVNDPITGILVKYSDFTVKYTDINTIELHFNTRLTGVMQCIAKYNNTVTQTEVNTLSNLIPITWNNTATVAIPANITNPILNMVLVPLNKPISYGIPQRIPLVTNAVNLAWFNSNTIFINGRTYNVFTFEVPTINGNIHSFDQYSFYFTSVSNNIVVPSSLLFLLAAGTESVDKTMNSVIDGYQFTLNDNNIINNSVMYVSSSLVKPVFPAITIL